MHGLIRTHQITDSDDLPDDDPRDCWRGILTATRFAMNATVHATTRATPTQLVFNRDAMHNVRFEADWQHIKDRKQKLIQQNNKRENARLVPDNTVTSATVTRTFRIFSHEYRLLHT